MSTDTSRISITAEYTAYVWFRNKISSSEFISLFSRIAFFAIYPVNKLMRLLTGADLEDLLLQRHKIIDHLLMREIEDKGVVQIVELACGLSPRGYRFSQKYAHISYIEVDLPEMAHRKRCLLQNIGDQKKSHRVLDGNILEVSGLLSLESIFAEHLDKGEPVIVITEGLINYFSLDVISGMWERLAVLFKDYPGSLYLADNIERDMNHPSIKTIIKFKRIISFIARGDVPFHFTGNEDTKAHFIKLGFSDVTVHYPADYIEKLKVPESPNGAIIQVIGVEA